ncbi:MAG: cyclohexanone monooxygenase [Halioglobus sp.]|jgi:cyclohexanone monooxygenase
MPSSKTTRVAIIGAGPSGIAAGRELLQKGFSHFTIFDALDAPGGTWRLHNYPGLACDVWAHSYTFSYAPNPNWSASFVDQPEIQAYLARCATEFGLDDHLVLNTRIESAHYDDDASVWQLRSDKGEQWEFDTVINAMGNQHTPLFPDVKSRESFTGESFHGTRWNHDVDLSGKRVAIIGSAASAVQIVPEVAKTVGELWVVQRSPNWIMPRGKKEYSEKQRARFARFPILMKMLRKWQSTLMGQVEYAVTLGHSRMGQFEKMVHKFIERTTDDPALREALTPDSRYGCKRGLVSDGFYPALNEEHVHLVAQGLAEVTPTGIITESGKAIDVDVIIYCTGYRILDFDRIDVRGVNNSSLAEVMADNPQAHKGIAVPDFPNYFFAVGPNGLVLNVSYFITAEKSIETIVRLMENMEANNYKSVTVKKAEFEQYNDWMSDRFGKFSWGASDCKSYYRNASGHAPFLFPGNYKEFKRLHEDCTLAEFECA